MKKTAEEIINEALHRNSNVIFEQAFFDNGKQTAEDASGYSFKGKYSKHSDLLELQKKYGCVPVLAKTKVINLQTLGTETLMPGEVWQYRFKAGEERLKKNLFLAPIGGLRR